MGTKKIYLASSWRNTYQPAILQMLRLEGFEVYDFRNPQTGGPHESQGYRVPAAGFSWKQADPDWGKITPDIIERYKRMLEHPVAKEGFAADFNAMKWADTCVLLLPSGRSAHLEAGWMSGTGRRLVVYMPTAVGDCTKCGGSKLWYTETTEGRVARPCPHCEGTGIGLQWSFEPELMYLIGGNPSLICTTPKELVDRLHRPGRERQATLDPAGITVHTTELYPMVGEKPYRDPPVEE